MRPQLKVFYEEKKEFGEVNRTWWEGNSFGTSTNGTRELQSLFGQSPFSFPKPTTLLIALMKLATRKNDIILDFFSGSATTAHAVMQLNAEDGGNRKFIMIQLPEPCDAKSEAFKAGYKTIAEISKERIRRAGQKISADCAGKRRFEAEEKSGNLFSEKNLRESAQSADKSLDTGFRVFKIDTSNMADVYYTSDTFETGQIDSLIDNIKHDRTAEDLLFQVMLDWGVDLALPIRKEIIYPQITQMNADSKSKEDNLRESAQSADIKTAQLSKQIDPQMTQITADANNENNLRESAPSADSKTVEVFFVDGNALVACFDACGNIDENLVRELAQHQPLRVVFRDAGFASDSVKINVEQIFKLLSPGTEVKCI